MLLGMTKLFMANGEYLVGIDIMNCKRLDHFHGWIPPTALGVPMTNPLAVIAQRTCKILVGLGRGWEDTSTESKEGKAGGVSVPGVPRAIPSGLRLSSSEFGSSTHHKMPQLLTEFFSSCTNSEEMSEMWWWWLFSMLTISGCRKKCYMDCRSLASCLSN